MEQVRPALLVVGTLVITIAAMVLVTQRDESETQFATPLQRPAVEPADVTALVASIERLVEALERASPTRFERTSPTGLEGVSAAPSRQPAGPSVDASLAELLREQNEQLAQIHAVLLAEARTDDGAARTASKLRATVEAGPRPIRTEAWEAFFTRHPPSTLNNLPVELAVLGVAEVMEKFGWPTQVVPPQTNGGVWALSYRDLSVRTPDGVVTHVQLNCARDATYYLSHN